MKTCLSRFEMWAMWCHNGGRTKQTSMVGKMMDNAGYLTFGGSGSCEAACVESQIESLVSGLSKTHPRQAKALRIQHGASNVNDLNLSGEKKAAKILVSQATFYREVKRAEKFVNLYL